MSAANAKPPPGELLDVARVMEAHLSELLTIARRTEVRDAQTTFQAALRACEAPRDVAALWHESSDWMPPALRRTLWRWATARVHALGQDRAAAWLKVEVESLRKTPLQRLLDAITEATTPDACVAVWRANRTVVAALAEPEQRSAWASLVTHTEKVGRMKNADAWLKNAIKQADEREAREKGAGT